MHAGMNCLETGASQLQPVGFRPPSCLQGYDRRGAGIYHVTTMPTRRGQGLGRALTLAAMQAARSARYAAAILFATPSGYPLYSRMGFETVATADLYGWNGVEQPVAD